MTTKRREAFNRISYYTAILSCVFAGNFDYPDIPAQLSKPDRQAATADETALKNRYGAAESGLVKRLLKKQLTACGDDCEAGGDHRAAYRKPATQAVAVKISHTQY